MEYDDLKKTFSESYTIQNLVVISVVCSVVGWGFILLALYAIASAYSGHPWQSIPTNTDFIISAVWCLAAYLLAMFLAYSTKNNLKNLFPSWLVISFFGSFIWIISLNIYLYEKAIRNYDPNSPCLLPPPANFYSVLISALGIAFVYFIFSCILSSLIFYFFLRDNKETSIHLNQ